MPESIVAGDDNVRLVDDRGATRVVIRPGLSGPVAIFLNQQGEFAGGVTFSPQDDKFIITLTDTTGVVRAALTLVDHQVVVINIDPDGNPLHVWPLPDGPHNLETLFSNLN